MPGARLGDRSLFTKLEGQAYLAHAAISPLSDPVVERVTEVASDYARGGMAGFVRWAPRLKRVRQQLASLIAASPDELAFVANTSTGVIDVAFGIAWKPGDRIVLFEGEFPANVTPWQQAAKTFGLELVWVSLDAFQRSADEGMAELKVALSGGARIVAVSAVQFKTGLRMPLERMAALAHESGAELFVDAIQALGATPIDVGWGIDYLSAGSHKHLMGAEGTGLLYCAGRCAANLEPRLAGWLGHEDPIGFLIGDEPRLRHDVPFQQGALALETGTSNVIGIAALGVSVALIEELGVSSIHAHVQTYLDRLEEGLEARGFESLRSQDASGRSTLLGVRIPEDVRLGALAGALRDRGIVCNTPDGMMRFAPHWPNAVDEVSGVLDAVDEALAELRG